MTPYQLAKTQCVNLTLDVTCFHIKTSSWHDYRVPLPDWISEIKHAGISAAIESLLMAADQCVTVKGAFRQKINQKLSAETCTNVRRQRMCKGVTCE